MAQKKTPQKKPTKVEDPEDQDTDPQEPGEGTEDPEDSDADPEAENRRINAIVTSRVKREMKAVNQQLTQLMEAVKGLSAPKKEESDDEDPEAEVESKKDLKANSAAVKRFTRLEKELAEQKTRAEKAERERSEELERGKRNEMRNMFQAALTDYGVTDPRLMRAALDQLEQDGYMLRDEDGKVKFKGQDKWGVETLFDPKAGLKNWVQQEGKSFIPAVEASGSGTGPARNTGSTHSKSDLSKMSAQQKAAIEIDRASQGLPPLE